MTMKTEPYILFKKWFEEAIKNEPSYPDALSLATSDKKNQPSVRIVLLKKFEEDDFIFFTNYSSHKAEELLTNPKAELLFYWKSTKKQIRIRGKVEKISKEASDSYWESRDYTSRLNSYLSKQSSTLPEDFSYHKEIETLKKEFPEKVPRPDGWGGYSLKANYFEFWQEGDYRWHTRFSFTKKPNGGWDKTNLFP